MTKQEIEKAIENGENVWCFYVSDKSVEEIYFSKNNKYDFEEANVLSGNKKIMLVINNDWYYPLEYLFKTKAEAEHYLHHANISRIEQLPFLTWEEFLKEYSFDFYSSNHEWFTLYWNDADGIVLENIISIDDKKTWDLTEENFYKAYDECVRLFKGEE